MSETPRTDAEPWDTRLETVSVEFARTLEMENERLRAALETISKGRGEFSLDPLTHATNTIDDMKAIAIAADPLNTI